MGEALVQFAQKAIVLRDGNLLMVRDARGWDLPGGRLHDGETLAEALVREVREETGLTVALCRGIEACWEWTAGERRVVGVARRCALAGEPGTLRAGDDADEVAWIPLNEIGGLELASGLRRVLGRVMGDG